MKIFSLTDELKFEEIQIPWFTGIERGILYRAKPGYVRKVNYVFEDGSSFTRDILFECNECLYQLFKLLEPLTTQQRSELNHICIETSSGETKEIILPRSLPS